MRALALQPEIRFQTVEEFDAAITAKKETRDAKSELRHRKRVRNIRIAAIFLVIIGLGGAVGMQYFKQYEAASLTETTLQMWVRDLPSEDGSDTGKETEAYYDAILEQFRSDYPKVTVEVTALDRDTYEKTIGDALESGNGPDLFEAAGEMNLDFYKESSDAFFEDNPIETDGYYYLGNYDSYFPDGKDIPIAVNVPVVYENAMTEDLPDSENYEDYTNESANFSGTFLDYDQVQEDMAGVYSIREENTISETDFIYSFAVNSQTSDENKNAAFRIIYYMLSDTSQETLALTYGLGIPLDKTVWAEYVEYNADFEFLTEALEQQ
jgi:ABC-type glycerol-3-phosphate transport system substrate-binding protein